MFENNNTPIVLEPYNNDVAEAIFSELFRPRGKYEHETEDGLTEIPADSYQIVVSALELMKYEVHGKWNNTIKEAIYIVERLRDTQKMREWKRWKESQDAQKGA